MDGHRRLLSGVGQSSTGTPERLTVSGLYFVNPQGSIVIRRSITAFTLPKRFATGRADDALRYLDWVASQGFNECRAFTRVDWTGPPGSGVESGWEYDEAACERTLTEAAARGLRVEMVAHTGPNGDVWSMADHLKAVDQLCLRHDNALLEVWNEPQQNGGADLLNSVLALYTPQTPSWASGWYDPTPYPNGSTTTTGPAMTYHSPRKDEWSRCFKDAYEYSTGDGPNEHFTPAYKGPVQQDEPPQVEQTIRDEGRVGWPAADDWEAYAAGSAFFAAGATLHGNPDFQQCVIPQSHAVLDCVTAFVRGFSRVPVQAYHGYSGALQPPPTNNPGSRRYQRDGADGRRYQITVRPFSFAAV